MQSALSAAVRTSLLLTAALLAAWVILANSSSNLPLEWSRAGSTLVADTASALAVARN